MSASLDLTSKLEIRDVAGHLVGYVVPAAEDPSGRPSGEQPRPDMAELERRCQELASERAKLLEEVAELRAQRAEYMKALCAAMHWDVTMTEEEARAIEREGVTFDQIVEDLMHLRG
jgi:hypothetical protein